MHQPPQVEKTSKPPRWAFYVVAAGGTVAAFALIAIVWSLAVWYRGGEYVPPSFFWVAAMLAIVGWGVLKLWARIWRPGFWRAWPMFAQTVLVVMALLLGLIGLAYYGDNIKGMAYVVAMRYDLRNLLVVQQQFFADSGSYTSDLGDRYGVSHGVVGPHITLTADGWTAFVRHTGSTRTCAIFVGATPLAPAVREGEPRCTPLPFPASVVAWGLAFVGIGVLLGAFGGRVTNRTTRN